MSKRKKLEKRILSLFSEVGRPLTLAETSQQLGETEKDVYKALRHMFETEQIESVEGRRYKLTEQRMKSS